MSTCHFPIATCMEGNLRLLVGDGTTFYLNENTYEDYYFIKDKLGKGQSGSVYEWNLWYCV